MADLGQRRRLSQHYGTHHPHNLQKQGRLGGGGRGEGGYALDGLKNFPLAQRKRKGNSKEKEKTWRWRDSWRLKQLVELYFPACGSARSVMSRPLVQEVE